MAMSVAAETAAVVSIATTYAIGLHAPAQEHDVLWHNATATTTCSLQHRGQPLSLEAQIFGMTATIKGMMIAPHR